MSTFCNVLNMGVLDYIETYYLQQKLQLARIKGCINDTLLLLEHNPVFTIGCEEGEKHILCSKEVLEKENIKAYRVNRGGNITYHGPGQLVCYPIIGLYNLNKDVSVYMRLLESVIIDTLSQFNVEGYRQEGLTGVWVEYKKIASIGIYVKKWVTMHGFAFNINVKLDHFKLINPCGLSNTKVTSLKKLSGNKDINMASVKEIVIDSFENIFDLRCQVKRCAHFLQSQNKGLDDESFTTMAKISLSG